jgi:hypothetical protein
LVVGFNQSNLHQHFLGAGSCWGARSGF